ncbi:hypothetical protein DFH28DRAFT_1065924 [Melampsora americana]|nr:hypothetical protein DFH28DRAFT_1065924 [Melampsora americana]
MNGQDTETANSKDKDQSHPKTNGKTSDERERMSRALGAAFLQHQVQQLERNLDDMSFRRDIYQAPHPRHHSSRTKQADSPRKIKMKSDNSQNPSGSSSFTRQEKGPTQIKIIDTSILIFALPVLKRWKAEGKYRIVIPLDVISTLDLLKTYPRPIRGLVRDATDWLDNQFQKLPASRGKGPQAFSPQVTGEECSWDQLRKCFIPPPMDIISVIENIDEENTTKRALESKDMPRRLRSVLQCAHWQQSQETGEPYHCTLAVFIPPETNTSTKSDTTSISNSTTAQHPISQNHGPVPGADPQMDRSGALMLEWAPRFGIEVEQITKRDLTEASSWIRHESEKRIARNKQSSFQRQSNPNNSSQYQNSPRGGGGSGTTDKRLFVW